MTIDSEIILMVWKDDDQHDGVEMMLEDRQGGLFTISRHR